jgi:hypothetical protein
MGSGRVVQKMRAATIATRATATAMRMWRRLTGGSLCDRKRGLYTGA